MEQKEKTRTEKVEKVNTWLAFFAGLGHIIHLAIIHWPSCLTWK